MYVIKTSSCLTKIIFIKGLKSCIPCCSDR